MENRRSHPRHDLDWPIFLRGNKKQIQVGELVNISLSGVQLSLSESVNLKEIKQYDLFICRPNHSTDLMEISGKIVWRKPKDQSKILGIALGMLDSDNTKMLEQFISHREELSIQMDLVLEGPPPRQYTLIG